MNTGFIIALVAAIIGSGGISAIISSIINAKKSNSEASRNVEESNRIRTQTRIDEVDFINKRLQEISEKFRVENADLTDEVAELNSKLQLIMEWIIYDNQKYRQWLETELRKVNPDVQFPECAPPPKIFTVDKRAHDSNKHKENDGA